MTEVTGIVVVTGIFFTVTQNLWGSAFSLSIRKVRKETLYGKEKEEEKRFQIRFPIWNDFTFKEVFSDPEITKAFLESLLGIRIQKLVYVHAEEEIRPDGKGRNIRLDIMAMDENGVLYDIEMQGEYLDVIPYRYRTNGSAMDARLIPEGIRTNELKKIPKRYIIFICRNDPFGYGLRQYTV